MRKMRKFLLILTVIAMCLSLTACGGSKGVQGTGTATGHNGGDIAVTVTVEDGKITDFLGGYKEFKEQRERQLQSEAAMREREKKAAKAEKSRASGSGNARSSAHLTTALASGCSLLFSSAAAKVSSCCSEKPSAETS